MPRVVVSDALEGDEFREEIGVRSGEDDLVLPTSSSDGRVSFGGNCKVNGIGMTYLLFPGDGVTSIFLARGDDDKFWMRSGIGDDFTDHMSLSTSLNSLVRDLRFLAGEVDLALLSFGPRNTPPSASTNGDTCGI